MSGPPKTPTHLRLVRGNPSKRPINENEPKPAAGVPPTPKHFDKQGKYWFKRMLESRAFSIEEICRWFRVPPFMVGHTTKQSSWASSLEGMNLQFLTHTLRPLLVNIEQEIGRCLLDSDDEVFAEFSVEGLLRADILP